MTVLRATLSSARCLLNPVPCSRTTRVSLSASRTTAFPVRSMHDRPDPDSRRAKLDLHLRSGFRFRDPVSWGFVIYRCCYKNEEAWRKMLECISLNVQSQMGHRIDLASQHHPVLMDDKARFDGANSHEIRDHFSLWVADELEIGEPRGSRFRGNQTK